MRTTSAGLLEGRVAAVTGGARGLGAEIVEAYAAAGACGVALDVDVDPATPPPTGWSALELDVRDVDAVGEALATAAERLGRLDVVVANAGVAPPWRETDAIDFREWDDVFAVNVRGVAATIAGAVPVMRKRGGSIVAMASLNAWQAHPRQCLYTATKHAVAGIVRATALDVGRHAIRVNAIAPGPIATDALLGRVSARARAGGPLPEAALRLAAADTALGRLATTGEVAGTALYLASDLSSGVTGQLLPVDAGVA